MALKDRLNNLTGLQRVLLVAFLVCWGYFALWGSLVKTEDANKGNADYAWAVSRDFANPACLPYTTKPMSELTEPKYGSAFGGSCWHIYTHRKFHENEIKLPFTEEAYNRGQSWDTFGMFSSFLGIHTVFVIIAFALVFGGFRIGKWIFAGFNKNK